MGGLRRDDLRVKCQCGMSHHNGDSRRVSDAELAELIESMGYVKASYPESMTLTDWQALLAEAAESVAREWMEKDGGWVKRPVCGECEGEKVLRYPPDTTIKCPSCGGTGFGRLVALTVDALSVAIEDATHKVGIEFEHYEQRVETCDALARQVLAAIDGEVA